MHTSNNRPRFVLDTYQGIPYFSYHPDRLTRSSFLSSAAAVKLFAELDSCLRNVPESESGPYALLAEAVLSKTEFGTHGGGGGAIARLAERLVAKRKLTTVELIDVNAVSLGLRRSGLRSGSMWLGSAHPSDAWYVAPPAIGLPKLMDNLIDFVSDEKLPVTLRACVGLRQLLQVHPFVDGNGRTARAYFLAVLIRELGRRAPFISVLAHLWQFRAMAMHHTSLHLRDKGEWGPFLDLSLAGFTAALNMSPSTSD